MTYRVFEIEPGLDPADLSKAEPVAEYDNAYRALSAMRLEFMRGGARNWHLLDPSGKILIAPHDLGEAA